MCDNNNSCSTTTAAQQQLDLLTGKSASKWPSEQISQLQEMTGATTERCVAAMDANGGDAQAAAAMILLNPEETVGCPN